MEMVTIAYFLKQLRDTPAREYTIPRLLEFARQNRVNPETPWPYLFYAKSHYTRNLIFKCELFEAMAICWDGPGHVFRRAARRFERIWQAFAGP